MSIEIRNVAHYLFRTHSEFVIQRKKKVAVVLKLSFFTYLKFIVHQTSSLPSNFDKVFFILVVFLQIQVSGPVISANVGKLKWNSISLKKYFCRGLNMAIALNFLSERVKLDLKSTDRIIRPTAAKFVHI